MAKNKQKRIFIFTRSKENCDFKHIFACAPGSIFCGHPDNEHDGEPVDCSVCTRGIPLEVFEKKIARTIFRTKKG